MKTLLKAQPLIENLNEFMYSQLGYGDKKKCFYMLLGAGAPNSRYHPPLKIGTLGPSFIYEYLKKKKKLCSNIARYPIMSSVIRCR